MRDNEWMRQAMFRKDRPNVEQMQKEMTEMVRDEQRLPCSRSLRAWLVCLNEEDSERAYSCFL